MAWHVTFGAEFRGVACDVWIGMACDVWHLSWHVVCGIWHAMWCVAFGLACGVWQAVGITCGM